MGVSNFIDTETTKDSISWKSLTSPTLSNEMLDKIIKQAEDDAEIQKHDNNSKYKTTLTDEEIIFLNEIKEDINNKDELIGTICSEIDTEVDKKINQLSENKNFSIDSLESKYEREFNTHKSNLTSSIRKVAKDIIGAERHLRLFRKRNDLLHRDAEYPKSKILFWGIILIVLVGESMANAYFYAQGSDLGLLGGLLQAFLVSVANLAISFVIGFILLRTLNHVSNFKKALAILGLIIALPILFFLHLVSAHYRELLMHNPDDATRKVLFETWNQPFNISDFDSLILIIIGFIISIVVIWKSYRFDDPYPGYGKVWRKWEKTHASKEKYVKEYKEGLNETLKYFEDDFKRLNNNLKNEMDNFNKLEKNIDNFRKTVYTYFDNIVDIAKRVVIKYRSTYNDIAQDTILELTPDVEKYLINYLDVSKLTEDIEKSYNNAIDVHKKFKSEMEAINQRKNSSIERIKNLKKQLSADNEIKAIINNSLDDERIYGRGGIDEINEVKEKNV